MNYVVKSVRDSGTITYHCATIEGALEKLRDFRLAEYRNIRVSAKGGRFISPSQLASLAVSRTFDTSRA